VAANLALFGIGCAVNGIAWALTIVVLVAVAANAYLIVFSWKARRYLNALKHRIQALET
jgi:hypothetical protein